MKATMSVALLTSVTALALGCQKSQEKQAEELAETRQNAAENIDDAQREAAEKSAKAYNEANQEVVEEQAKVNKEAVELNRTIESARTDVRNEVVEQLGKIDKRIVDLQTKITTAKTTKAPREELQQSLRGIQSKSELLHKDVDAIQATTTTSLDTIKTSFRTQIDQLEKALDELERRV